MRNTPTFSDLFKSLANNFTTDAIISSINKTLVKKYNLPSLKVEEGENIFVSHSEYPVDFETLVTEPLGISKKSIDLQSNQKLDFRKEQKVGQAIAKLVVLQCKKKEKK